MRSWVLRGALSVATSFLLLSLFAGCGGGAASSSPGASSAPPSSQASSGAVKLTDGFLSPFIVVINAGQSVTWTNTGSTAHNLVTTPQQAAPQGDTSGVTVDASAFLNPESISHNIAAGSTASQTFTKPGIYHYYDSNSATWDAKISRVSANKDTLGFPYAIEGIIWVQGALNSLPTNAKNGIMAGHDDFLYEFVAIQKGGTVSWQNFDTDKHDIAPGYGFSPPINPAQMGDGINLIKGTKDAPPHGQTLTLTFNTPGLYYYYCSLHADFVPGLLRAKAHPDASEYPVPMEGFVLVNG